MDTRILARLTRAEAVEIGEEAGIRPFYAIALMRLDRSAAVELCQDAVRQHPREADARGLYVRNHAVRQTK